MALPKELTAALDAWKDGKGEFPEALNHGSFFENDGLLQKVINGKLGPAQKAARAEAEAQLLEIVGVTDPEQLKEIKHKLAEAAGTITEVEKLRASNAKWEKEQAKTGERIKELEGFKVKVLKAQAIEPHLSKVHPDLRSLVRENLEGKLKIEGDKVLAPEGVEVGSFLDDMIKATPSLKAPDFQSGAGTGPNGGKTKATPAASTSNGAGNGATTATSANGTAGPQSLGTLFSAVLREKDGEGTAQ